MPRTGRGGSSPLQRIEASPARGQGRLFVPRPAGRPLTNVSPCASSAGPPSTRRWLPAPSYADARAILRRTQDIATKNGEVESIADGESRGDRSARPGRRRLGVRLRPPPLGLRRQRSRRACDRVRPGQRVTHKASGRPRSGERRAGRIPDTVRARSDRRSARGEDRAPPASGRVSPPCRRDDHASRRAREPGAARVPVVRRRRCLPGVRGVRRRSRGACDHGRSRPGPELSERARRFERPGRLGVRGRPGARRARSADRRGGRRAAPGGPVPPEGHDRRDRLGADAAPGARVRRPPDRARPDLRNRGGLRRHELPEAGRSRVPSLRLRAHEHHGRLHDAARPRHVRLRRRGSPRAPRADRERRHPRGLPGLPRDRVAPRRGWRRVDAGRRLEPDAAGSDDEPPPGARRGNTRRPPRRRRRRDPPRHQQELVDRRQAPELPVRDTGCVGDQEGQARPAPPRCDLHGRHARVLGLAGRLAGKEEWTMGGLTNCGKGQPGQSAHVSHGAPPARFRQVRVGIRS